MRSWFCLISAIALCACNASIETPTPVEATGETAPTEETEILTEATSTDETTGTTNQQGATSIQQLLENLGYDCGSSTVIGYRGQTLQSPDGTAKAYTTGSVRKTVSAEQAQRAANTDGYCFGDSRETLERQIVIEGAQGTQTITSDYYDGAYAISEPQAISPDSRYLIVQSRIEFVGGDPSSSTSIYSLATGEPISTIDACERTEIYFVDYLGFFNDSEVALQCGGYGDATTYIAFDIATSSTRQLPNKPTNLTTQSGKSVSPFEVTTTKIIE